MEKIVISHSNKKALELLEFLKEKKKQIREEIENKFKEKETPKFKTNKT